MSRTRRHRHFQARQGPRRSRYGAALGQISGHRDGARHYGDFVHPLDCGWQTSRCAQPLRGAPRLFSAVDSQLARLLAGQAAIAVTAALRHYDEVTLSDHLRIALSSRSVIDQAIGIVMAQRRCSPEEAFATLRTISQRRNIKLRDIAAELVDATRRPSQDNPPPA